MAAARTRGHPHLLRLDRGAQGHLAHRRGGRGRHADRLQRRRQVDDAALDLRADAAAQAGSIRFRGEEISTMPAQEIVRLGISQSPEGRRCFQRMTVRENLELGAYLRRDANVPERPRPRARAVPAAARARAPEGGHDVRRRAADARHGPRADGRPAAAAARRAVDGPRADPRRPHLRDGARDQQAGHDDPARGAERELRARGLDARLRAGDRARSCWPTTRTRSATTRRSRTPTWGPRR